MNIFAIIVEYLVGSSLLRTFKKKSFKHDLKLIHNELKKGSLFREGKVYSIVSIFSILAQKVCFNRLK